MESKENILNQMAPIEIKILKNGFDTGNIEKAMNYYANKVVEECIKENLK